jgi:integrase
MPTPILKTADNGIFYAHWSENRRSRRKSMGTADLATAQQRFAQWILLGGHKGEVAEEVKAALTVAELWSIYDQKHVQVVPVMPKNIENSWKNLGPFFGHLTLAEIDQDVVDEYEEKRTDGALGRACKPATVRAELIALRACFNWHSAAGRGKKRLVERRDLPVFDLPPEGAPRDRWLRTDEIEKILKAAKELHPGADRMSRGERFIWLALETAARKQAILDLTWDRVDFETGVIHFAVPGRRLTKKRRPSVPISNKLRPVLKQMHEERINNYVMDSGANVIMTIRLIVELSGIVPPPAKRKPNQKPSSNGISPHTFRHTAATHMARRGVPLYDIAGVLGNSLAMVERVYAKHCPGRLLAAVNAISPELEPAE